MLLANVPLLVLEMKVDYIASTFLVAIVAGFLEEYIMRGLLLGYLDQHVIRDAKSLWLSILELLLLLFGLVHVSNILNRSIDYTVFQVIVASLAGLFYGAVYFRTKSLIWGIFAHFLQDFAVLASSGLSSPEVQGIDWSLILILCLLYGGPTLLLLRPKKDKTSHSRRE